MTSGTRCRPPRDPCERVSATGSIITFCRAMNSSAGGMPGSSWSGPPTAESSYGTLKSEIEGIFAGGRHAVLDVEIEGARQIRSNFPNSLLLFVLPPSADALVQRLIGRKTEDPALVRSGSSVP